MPKIKPNIQKRKKPITRRPVLVVVIILVIAAIALIIAKILTNNAAEQSSTTPPSDNTTSQVDPQTSPLGEENTSQSADNQESPKTPKQYEGPDANTFPDITGAITYAEVNGDTLSLRLTIDQSLSSRGSCTLTATNGDKSITERANIINNPSSSSCEGFDIATSRLGSGTWQLKIEINADGKTGTITGEVKI